MTFEQGLGLGTRLFNQRQFGTGFGTVADKSQTIYERQSEEDMVET